MRSYFIFCNKKCRIYAACGVSQTPINAINKRGGSAKLTVYEDVAHNVWNNAFENTDMWNWMFAQKNQYIATKNEYDNVEKFG